MIIGVRPINSINRIFFTLSLPDKTSYNQVYLSPEYLLFLKRFLSCPGGNMYNVG